LRKRYPSTDVLGGSGVVARELTKMFEEFFRGTLAEATWAREKSRAGVLWCYWWWDLIMVTTVLSLLFVDVKTHTR
jgi:hypothetical protein